MQPMVFLAVFLAASGAGVDLARAAQPMTFLPGLADSDRAFLLDEVGVGRLPGAGPHLDAMEAIAADLDRDGRPEIFVRLGSYEACQERPCRTLLFWRGQKRWRLIMDVEARSIALARQGFDRLPDILVDDARVLRFDGKGYRRMI